MGETCSEHSAFCEKIGKLISSNESLHESLKDFCKKTELHINEGEKPGGVREKVTILEQRVSQLEKEKWVIAIVGGLVGGFISQGTPEFFQWLLHFIK